MLLIWSTITLPFRPLLAKLGINDPVLDIAKRLEEVALNDEYFIARKLYPNVDFYSGLIYKAMGFPTDMFPVLFGKVFRIHF